MIARTLWIVFLLTIGITAITTLFMAPVLFFQILVMCVVLFFLWCLALK